MIGATFLAKRSASALTLATARSRTSASFGLPRTTPRALAAQRGISGCLRLSYGIAGGDQKPTGVPLRPLAVSTCAAKVRASLLKARSALSCCGMFSTCFSRRAKVIIALWVQSSKSNRIVVENLSKFGLALFVFLISEVSVRAESAPCAFGRRGGRVQSRRPAPGARAGGMADSSPARSRGHNREPTSHFPPSGRRLRVSAQPPQ